MTPALAAVRPMAPPAEGDRELRILVRLRADGGADVGAALDAEPCHDPATLADALRRALPALLNAAVDVGVTLDDLLSEATEHEAPPPAAPPEWIAFARDDLFRVERRIVGRFPCAVTLRPDTVVVVASPEVAVDVRDVLACAGVGELPICGGCGCTEDQACATPEGACAWATRERDLCTACAARRAR